MILASSNALVASLLLCYIVTASSFLTFSYDVSLNYQGYHFCTGSIIDERFILTAASCFTQPEVQNDTTVRAGSYQLDRWYTDYRTESINIHPNFDPDNMVNDIALVRVDRDITFDYNVQPIELASSNDTYEGSRAVFSGWGVTGMGQDPSKALIYLETRVENNTECKKTYDMLQDSHICTVSNIGAGGCYGDAGDPLVIDNIQIGIFSFGTPCAVGKPDVFTRVSSFESWIATVRTYYTIMTTSI
ncbi:chymotrypsin-1-like [Xylocopa sonorina]|uniref:chymotrypsin-1-like n=1 Tax=Xylocopa sonorina TaxID=1818115 RepID=UPI00403AA4F5